MFLADIFLVHKEKAKGSPDVFPSPAALVINTYNTKNSPLFIDFGNCVFTDVNRYTGAFAFLKFCVDIYVQVG